MELLHASTLDTDLDGFASQFILDGQPMNFSQLCVTAYAWMQGQLSPELLMSCQEQQLKFFYPAAQWNALQIELEYYGGSLPMKDSIKSRTDMSRPSSASAAEEMGFVAHEVPLLLLLVVCKDLLRDAVTMSPVQSFALSLLQKRTTPLGRLEIQCVARWLEACGLSMRDCTEFALMLFCLPLESFEDGGELPPELRQVATAVAQLLSFRPTYTELAIAAKKPFVLHIGLLDKKVSVNVET